MIRDDPYWPATLAAENVIKDRGIAALPVDPIAIARDLGIEVMAKPASTQGVSGMLLRVGNTFGIAYATHIDSIGFQNFSVAHELGHYFLPGHIDAVFADGDVHESHAGFASGDRYEMEADHFAATLLMPRSLFTNAMRTAGDALAAIEKLADRCRTSLTATGIRYTRCSRDPVAIVLSTGCQINYCFMSDALKEVKGLNWIRKGEGLSNSTATFTFNQSPERVRQADRAEDTSDLQDWFGGDRSLSVTEQVIGLGSYGKTLTVLTALNIEEKLEEIEEEEELIESWTPRFRR
ncbi:MAG: ImmA/IrrE family metallo-endopeptidase [Acidobacteria bacterium]|nr:ImmA/IrrE family metallo-endopeptidase [Acidobacteriota bacterium]